MLIIMVMMRVYLHEGKGWGEGGDEGHEKGEKGEKGKRECVSDLAIMEVEIR